MSIAAVKERPVLFSAPMVRAILDGRKTQTRREVKFKGRPWLLPLAHVDYARDGMPIWSDSPLPQSVKDSDYFDHGMPCRYGKPGDRLWVRECVARAEAENGNELIVYKADMAIYDVYQLGNGPKSLNGFRNEYWAEINGRLRFTPSIHMPRWASRITLEVTEVRVERLNSISEADAIAEGRSLTPGDPRGYFPETWERINGKGSWDANPWVWVITFKRVEAAQ